MSTTVPLEEWDRLTTELREFADGEGTVEESDEEIRVDFGSAQVALTREGRVETGMPLHDFATADAVAIEFDHDAGEFHVRGEHATYRFERP
jgi:hypothetical protein